MSERTQKYIMMTMGNVVITTNSDPMDVLLLYNGQKKDVKIDSSYTIITDKHEQRLRQISLWKSGCRTAGVGGVICHW
jgi:hypothetical protein